MFSAADEERQRQRAEAKRQKEAKKRKKEAEKKKKAEQNDLISNILTSMPQHHGGKWRLLFVTRFAINKTRRRVALAN